MKVQQSTLVSILYNTLYRCVENDNFAALGSTNPINWEGAIEEAEFALAVMKAIRDGKKRIVLDIVKP